MAGARDPDRRLVPVRDRRRAAARPGHRHPGRLAPTASRPASSANCARPRPPSRPPSPCSRPAPPISTSAIDEAEEPSRDAEAPAGQPAGSGHRVGHRPQRPERLAADRLDDRGRRPAPEPARGQAASAANDSSSFRARTDKLITEQAALPRRVRGRSRPPLRERPRRDPPDRRFRRPRAGAARHGRPADPGQLRPTPAAAAAHEADPFERRIYEVEARLQRSPAVRERDPRPAAGLAGRRATTAKPRASATAPTRSTGRPRSTRAPILQPITARRSSRRRRGR